VNSTKQWVLNQEQIDQFANVTGMLAQMAMFALNADHLPAAASLAALSEKLGNATEALVATNMAPPFNKGRGIL
jgi:hypothetical protein